MNHQQLLLRTYKYISHAHHVWANTNKSNMNNLHYAEVLDRIAFCKKTANGINRFSGKNAVCRMILIMRKPLREILPHHLNNSYSESLTEYESIMHECEQLLKNSINEKYERLQHV